MVINKTVKNILGWVLYIIVLVGLVFGTPKALSYVLDTQYPMATITSGSMWPSLKKGDFIFIKGIDGREEINIGDIIVYKNPKGFTIHRIVKLSEETLVTKGDANNVEDAPVKYEEIIGKILTINNKPFRIPFLGSIGLLINNNKI